MATIKDVARMAGVSIATVSKFINGGNVRHENVDAISKAIETLDYRVNPFARSLKTQRSRAIGILIPDIATPYFGSVLTSLDKTLREHGYHSLISSSGCCTTGSGGLSIVHISTQSKPKTSMSSGIRRPRSLAAVTHPIVIL